MGCTEENQLGSSRFLFKADVENERVIVGMIVRNERDRIRIRKKVRDYENTSCLNAEMDMGGVGGSRDRYDGDIK